MRSKTSDGNLAQSAVIASCDSTISHHPHTPHRKQYRKCLPYPLIETRPADLLDHDGVRLPQCEQMRPGDLSEEPHPKTGLRKRVFHQNFIRQPQVPPDTPHLVLEQVPQRFNQVKWHFLG